MMSMHRCAFFVYLIFSGWCELAIVGNIIYVDPASSDVSAVCGSSLINPCGTIQAALDNAVSSDVIKLLPGMYTGDGNEGLTNINQDNSVDLSKQNLVLTGDGSADEITIICSQSKRFIFAAGNFITELRNMTITGCQTPDIAGIIVDPTQGVGGALFFIEADVVLLDILFSHNRAEMGGAIAVKESNVTINGCNFVGNNATIFGGAIASDLSSLDISHTDFTSNKVSGEAAFLQITVDVVGRGGAIFASEGAFVNLFNCYFTNNLALISGGGMHLQYLTSASIDFIIFSQNSVIGSINCVSDTSCSIRGGALYVEDVNFVVSDSIFINNSVSTSTLNKFAEGGGIFMSAVLNRVAEVVGSQFYENYAYSRGDNNAGGYGGAIATSNVQLRVSKCEFELNYVSAGGLFTEYSSNGGAIWVSGEKQVVIEVSVFFSNRAVQGTAGAIFVTDALNVFIQNCTFTANIAQSSYVQKAEGGAIVISHNSYLTVVFCDFLRNLAEPVYSMTPLTYSGSGGGIYIQSASANISHCRFSNNHVTTGQFDSGGSGGAISMINSPLTHIVDCRFILNSARGYAGAYSYSSSGTGGAISMMFSSAIIDETHFNYNWVSAGGTEYSLGGAVSIFYDNTNKGAIPVQIMNSEFRGNIATGEICTNTVVYKAGEGGALSVFGSDSLGVDITNVLFLENVADTQSTLKTTSAFGGAVMLSQSSTVRMHGCNFSSNIAHNGYAADISSITDSEESQIYLNLTDCYFKRANNIAVIIEKILAKIPELSCNDGTADYLYYDWTSANFNEQKQLFTNSRIRAVRTKFLNERSYRHVDRSEVISQLEHGKHVDARRSVEFVRSRLLESVSEDEPTALDVEASIIVGAGSTRFENPFFVGEYHIFAGNIVTAVLEEEYSYYDIDHCRITFAGNIDGSGLNIIALKSDIIIGEERNASIFLEMSNLILFNSSLMMNYDINVTGVSVIMGSTIFSNHFSDQALSNDRSIPIPVLSYLGALHSGFFDLSSFGSQFQPFENIETAIFSPDIFVDNVAVRVFNYYAMSSTRISGVLPGKNITSYIPDLNLHISHFGTVEIFEYAVLHLTANLSVYDRSNMSSCGLVNRGEIILGKPQVSWKSVIDTKEGCFRQTKTGLLTVTVNSFTNYRPLITTKSRSTIEGTVNVTLFRGNSTKLNLYGGDEPSNWLLFGFKDDDMTADKSDLEIIAPVGLSFITDIEQVDVNPDGPALNTGTLETSINTHNFRGSSMSLRASSELDRGYSESAGNKDTKRSATSDGVGYKETLILNEMACDQISSYYVPDPSEGSVNCSVCLKNSSCGFCFSSDVCIMEGSGCSGNFENKNGNCCPEMCNDHGHCKSDLTCECYFLYTSTSNCKEWSVYFFIIIFGCIFIVFFFLLSLRYYISYRRQKENVLEKLRKRLLSGENGNDGKEGGFVTNNFLQNLQQDLILRDVFVNNDEIKLEEKIGEGSFGVVFKASFRGAQVAVKQMRSPVFLQLSENDIDEFRKEAYMMSRLRHPNIVLVMGVSVVEQEIAPPTSRSNIPIEMEDDFGNPKEKIKPKAVKSICIITEYLEQGSLADILYGSNKIAPEMWSYELALVCALQAARGMLYLHSHSPPICHRDLKSSNLVVDDHWVVKVTDFGMSRMVPEKLQDIEIGLIADDSTNAEGAVDGSEDRPSLDGSASRPSFDSSMRESAAGFNPMMTSNLGTTAWCAPELLTSSNKTRYSVKVDVYSFGLVLWELWERKRPYEDLYSRFDIIDAIRAGRRPPISASCPPALKSLIQRCWHGQPARRPTFSYIVRYLKDELARIKRQRLASSSSSNSSMRWASTGGYNPPSFSAGTSTDVGPPAEVINAMHREVTSSSEQSSSMDAGQGPGWRRFLNSTDDSGPSMEGTPTGGKSWLVRGRQNSAAGTSPQASGPIGGGGGGAGTWRDRYVMKFSGWQASRPDTGLPPSVSGNSVGQGRERRVSSNAMPIPPPPVRPQPKSDGEAIASSSGSAGVSAFSSMRNIMKTGTSPGQRRSVSSGHSSARSAERERERELDEAGGRHHSGGVSLQSFEQMQALSVVGEGNTEPSSSIDNSNDGASDSGDRSRMRSLSC